MMDFIVAVDGSEPSERALAHAIEMSKAANAKLTVVYAVDPAIQQEGAAEPVDANSIGDNLIIEGVEDAEARADEILENAAAFAAEHDLEVETELLYGDPATAVSDFAKEMAATQVFVGHRGLSEKYERVLGSVAKDLIEHAPLPVTVVSE